MLRPDVEIRISFFPTEKGGLIQPIQSKYLRRPLKVNNSLFECMIFDQDVLILPGETYVFDVKFLSPEIAMQDISVGDYFTMADLNEIADGNFTKKYSEEDPQ
ncbi:MAG: hypothetical protein KA292_06190 [Sphingorhabdus sp.]|nr:hypothetical protein [Sphingorhabdus sp.]